MKQKILIIAFLVIFLVSGGYTANVDFSFPAKQGKVEITRYQEDISKVSFVVESDTVVDLVIKPSTYQIKAGKLYSINPSYFYSFFVKAEKDGELNLNLDSPKNCTIIIEDGYGNLLTNGSFEEIGDVGKVIGWDGKLEARFFASMGWGHESMPKEGLAVDSDDIASVNTGVTDKYARNGKYSYMLTKGAGMGTVELNTASGVSLETGKNYVLTAFYKPINARHGSSINLFGILNAPGKETKYFNEDSLSPMYIDTPKGKWNWAMVKISVPSDYIGAKLGIKTTAAGSPFSVCWDDFELRIAPSPSTQIPPTTTAEKAKPKFSAEEVMQKFENKSAVKVQKPVPGKSPLLINGKPVSLFAYTSHPDPSQWPMQSSHKDFFQAGLKLQFIPLDAGFAYDNKSISWLADGKYDFSLLEKEITTTLGYDPEAAIGIYLYLQPYQAFGDVHPDARWVNAMGQTAVNEKENWKASSKRDPGEAWMISYTAPSYQREVVKYLQALAQFLKTSPVGKQVVGLQLAGGTDGQWFVHGWGRGFGSYDHSSGTLEYYRDYLKRKYNSNLAAFKKAYGDQKLTFETAQMPSEDARAPQKYYLDPKIPQDKRIIDANIFTQEGVAETINLFAREFKKALGRESFVMTYYHKKHHGARFLLNAPDLDGMVGVMEYQNWRPLGRTGHNEDPVASLNLHNKMYLSELDYRTEYSDFWGSDGNEFRTKVWVATRTPEEAANQLRRDLGNTLTQFEGSWIYALPGNGWVTEAHVANMEEGAKAAMLAATKPMPSDYGQMAVFMDEAMEDYASNRDIYGPVMHYMGNYIPRTSINRSGLPWDDYLLGDIDNPNRAKYKLNLFTTAATITPNQIAWIKKNMQKDGNVLIFVNDAGYHFGDGFEKNIKELTGMNIKVDLTNNTAKRYSRVGSDPLSKGVEDLLSEYTGPLFYVEDKTATPLAKITGTNKIGVAVKRYNNWTCVYISMLGAFTPQLLNDIAKEAGITPAGPVDDVTYGGNGFLVIHALKAGQKTLRWNGKCDLFDLTTGTTIAKNAKSFTFDMDAFTTRWFRKLNVK